MRLWVPINKKKTRATLWATEEYVPDNKTWRPATRRERWRYAITRPRYSYVSFAAVWLFTCLLLGIFDVLTGARL